jgi:hypothetical protein
METLNLIEVYKLRKIPKNIVDGKIAKYKKLLTPIVLKDH